MMMLVLMALFMWLGYMFAGQTGMIIAFVMASAMNFFSCWYSDKVILKIYRAREVTENDYPKLYQVVKRVATIQAMMPMPKVYIIPMKASNAFATGRNVDHAAVAVTEGLLEILNEDELEGVIGHEIAHIRNKDMLLGTIVATFVGAIGILASIARWGAIFGGYSRDSNRNSGGIALLVTAIVAPLIAIVLQAAISRQREYKADSEGAMLTGKHLALASALDKLHRAPVRLNLNDRPGTANLMIANPFSGKGFSLMFSTHPPVEKRIIRLKQQAQDHVYQGIA